MQTERPRYIVVEGPIGVGKTTLAQLLAERLGGRLICDAVEENPFLADFNADRRKHGFQAQLFFLLSRFQQQQILFQQDLFSQSTVSDYLFAKDRIYATHALAPAELGMYDRLYEALGPRVVKPDLVIYLQSRTEVLLHRIRKRARESERHLDPAWIESLAKAYSEYFFHYEDTPLLVVNASDLDLEGSPEHVEPLLGVIRRHRKGTQHYVPLGTRT